MSAILIQADDRSRKLLQELAECLGAKVTKVRDEQVKDLMLGAMMDQTKTGRTVSRERVMKRLKGE